MDWFSVLGDTIAAIIGTAFGGWLVLWYTRRVSRADIAEDRQWRLRRDVAVIRWQAALGVQGIDRGPKVTKAKAELAELLGVDPSEIP